MGALKSIFYSPRALNSIHAQINNFTIYFYFICPCHWYFSPFELRCKMQFAHFSFLFTSKCASSSFLVPFFHRLRPRKAKTFLTRSAKFDGFPLGAFLFKIFFPSLFLFFHNNWSPFATTINSIHVFFPWLHFFAIICAWRDISLIAFYRHMVYAMPLNGMKARKSSLFLPLLYLVE